MVQNDECNKYESNEELEEEINPKIGTQGIAKKSKMFEWSHI